MEKKRIVITGMGLVSCFGSDIDVFYKKLLSGESGIVPIEEFPCDDYSTRFAGIIRGFDVGNYMLPKQARRVDPFLRYAMVAGKRALEHAQFSLDHITLNKQRAGIIIGSGMGGMHVYYDGVQTLIEKGYKRLTPFFVPYIITNMAGALLGIDVGFEGPNYSISTACATANFSIIAAAEEIRMGHADLMLCGGVEAAILPIGMAGFMSAKTLSTRNDAPKKASRPWDKDRDGFVMGEGSGVLVLETLEHAQKRNATIYAEYLGGYKNCDAYHMTNPQEDGHVVARCIEKALEDAQCSKETVNYINAHATSTVAGDLCELKAIREVFKDQNRENITLNATKSMIGHCLGAAGGIEAIATIQAINTHKIHPTINLENPDPLLEGFDVPTIQKEKKIEVALSSAFGFGGHNSVIVLAPYQESL
ncbi:MAG: beta-ketoacyl-ACP synthase II [Parachlamydiales bacterium]|nr:beta-ketoacyl-ACP synthase II [Parachlamydiales bacterium]